MKAKHQEKRENLEQIQKLKKRVQEKGDNMNDMDFDKIMGKGQPGKGKKKQSVIDTVRETFHQRRKQKQKFKQGKGGKTNRPGKVARMKGKR